MFTDKLFTGLRMFDAPDDGASVSDDGATKPEQVEDEPVDPDKPDDKPVIPNKDQRRIRQDAINQFKDSDEFKQMMAETLAEGEKRAKMSADEKAAADRKAEDERRAKDKAAFKRDKAEFRAERALTEAGLPGVFKDSLIFPDDDDGTQLEAQVGELMKAYNESVHDGVLKAMQGKQTPKSGTGNGVPTASITQEKWNGMKYSERLAVYNEDPELANKFMSQM